MNTNVTMHFTIEEMYASDTAKRLGIDNKPSVQQMINWSISAPMFWSH